VVKISSAEEWAAFRAQTVVLFGGERPGVKLEDDLAFWFGEDPVLVAQIAGAVGERRRLGKVGSGWAVLHTEVDRERRRPGPPPQELVDRPVREEAVARARQWLLSAGVFFPSRFEVEDELFGARGRLRAYAGDQALRESLLSEWESSRVEEVS
jgi:hypothetical protein